MVAVTPSKRLDPPANEVPLNDAGDAHTYAWAQYHQGMSDRAADQKAAITVLQAKLGTTTNDDATAGQVGEYINSTVPGGGVGLASNVATNITNISLTAGDWDVCGEIWFSLGAGGASDLRGGTSATSAVIQGNPGSGGVTIHKLTFTANSTQAFALATERFSLASTTTIYLVGYAFFGAGVVSSYGRISARRAR